MDWRQASTSRNRHSGRPLDPSQALLSDNDTAAMNSFLTFQVYKPFKTSNGNHPSTTNSSSDFFMPLADSDLSTSAAHLESVDEKSDGYSDYGANQLRRDEYVHRDVLDKLMDQVNKASEVSFNSSEASKPGPSGQDLTSASNESGAQPFVNRVTPARLSDFDSGILGLPTTPSHSSLLGSIPGLDQNLANYGKFSLIFYQVLALQFWAESMISVANADSQYGFLPRLIRKTSFDETLKTQPMLFRQSYLEPWNSREQNTNLGFLDAVGADNVGLYLDMC